MSPIELLALAAPASALAGAILGASAAYVASRKQAQTALAVAERQIQAARDTAHHQIEASTVVASRQRWIDELHADLSEMIAALLRLQIAQEKQSTGGGDSWIDEMLRATVLQSRIGLMLNPTHPHHEALYHALSSPLNDLRCGRQVNWAEASHEIMCAGQVVLKKAWDQLRADVKRRDTSISVLQCAGVVPNQFAPRSTNVRAEVER